jgi:O-antigen/teichoic acid export membrane protein
MIEPPIDRAWRLPAAVRPYLAPALCHVGWFGFFLILAPVVGPHGYGLFMLALGAIAMVEALLVAPASAALEGTVVLDERHWSTALVTMMVIGTAVSLALCASASTIGGIVGEDGFGDMFRSLATLPLLGSLMVVPSSALRREDRVAALSAASAAGFAAGGGIAVALAWAGAGAWSLVAQIIVGRLVECTVLWGIPGERIGIIWSRRHFDELAGRVDRRAVAALWPAATAYVPCLLVGAILGPTATGLYMLAARLGQAFADIFLPSVVVALREAVERASRVVLPTVLASTLLPIALPPILDLRWWGAALPAQIFVLSVLPAAFAFVGGAAGEEREDDRRRWRAAQALGGIAAITLAARLGLVAIAVATIGWASVVAFASLWPFWRKPPVRRRRASSSSGWLTRSAWRFPRFRLFAC